MRSITNIFFLYLFLPVVAFSASLKDFSASYKVYHNGFYVGNSSRELKVQEKNLTLTSTTKTAGLASIFFDITINETSKLQLKDKQVNFVSYTSTENNNGKREDYEFKLEKPQRVYNSYTKKYYPATKKLQAVFSFSVALMHDLQQGKREMEYSILEKERFNTFKLKFIKEEKLSTDDGDITTLKMEYYDKKDKFLFTMWCAKEMDFFPVRIRKINHKGDEDVFNLNQYNNRLIDLSLEDEEND